jgi:hypothetical protein
MHTPKPCGISPQGKQSFGCWQCCWMCCSFVAVMHAPSLVEFHIKVSRVLVVVFVPLIRIYNPGSIMALPCLLSGWPELSPISSDSISLVAYRVLGLVLFPLQDQHVECRICGVFHNMHHLQFLLQVLLNLSCCITILVSYFSVRVEDCKQCTSL